ncbi:MAG: gamma-glutamyltransferase [Gammaproteobacteria bacterium]|jgi:gamma-glutamyltranspeptidase / glutathione hydrolase|nr:gamma-glutamyltransferase [Gammaproteobacteria bacterium]
MKTLHIFLFCLFFSLQCYGANQLPPAAAIASAHPLATEAGLDILEQGGNAFDAAIAVTAALAVVEPYSSGIGGGGFWLLHRASDNKQIMIDGREKAPELAHRRMYLDENDQVNRGASINGALAAGIPGVPAGLVHLAQRYGSLPLEKSMAAAIRYAKEGFAIGARYQNLVSYRLEALQRVPEAAAIFLEDNRIPQIGFVVKQNDLAVTLERIAELGNDGFYHGELAEKLVLGVSQAGGVWSLKDLENYRVVERAPIVTNYRGMRVVSAPPPSSGGIVMGQALQILEHFDLDSMDSITRKHYVIESMRRAYRDRAVFLGDPDYFKVPVRRLLDKDYLHGLAINIDPDKATPSSELGNTPGLIQTGSDTTHFSVIDKLGNRVAATLSINLPFGSCFVAPGTGVLLNDEMDDFSIKPHTPNAYGLVGDKANSIEGGKRPLSSMTPTFIETDDRIGILGTPGGSRIISMVLLGVLDFADGNNPQSWVSLPRYHHQYLPDEVQYEKNGMSVREQLGLKKRGHSLKEKNRRYGNMQAILWDKKENRVYAASDPRGEGEAKVIAR